MARRSGVSLGTKLVIGTVFLLAAAIATNAWYSLTTMRALARAAGEARRHDLEEAIQREATALARNAAASSASLLGVSDYTKLDETAKRLAQENQDLKWILLLDNDNRVVGTGASSPKKVNDVYDDELTKDLAAAKNDKPVQLVKGGDELLLGANVVLADDQGHQNHVGQVRLAIDTSSLARAKEAAISDGDRRAAESARQQIIFAAIILLVGVLAGTWQGMRISRPLRALSQQARNIASGDFNHRVAVTRSDEVGELGESFNMMAESLGLYVNELTAKAGLEREVEVARSVQGLMTPPPDMMSLGSYRLKGRCEMASACGGDWWSYRTLSDGRLLVVLGDVTGHGMPSAMIAATGRGAVEALAMFDHTALTPQIVLQAIDRAIRDVGGRRLLMTCFALIISPDGHVSFANAGHTFPYVMRGAELSTLPVRSNPLGWDTVHIADGQYTLQPGDFMIMTSDGLTDRVSESGARFGDKRLRRTLVDQAKAQTDVGSLCDRIVEEVNQFGGQQPVDDDITLVIMQYTGSASGSGTYPAPRPDKKRGVAA
jgi:sigma-B regulation protein RsbU (phosphoserine phosphatase)